MHNQHPFFLTTAQQDLPPQSVTVANDSASHKSCSTKQNNKVRNAGAIAIHENDSYKAALPVYATGYRAEASGELPIYGQCGSSQRGLEAAVFCEAL